MEKTCNTCNTLILRTVPIVWCCSRRFFLLLNLSCCCLAYYCAVHLWGKEDCRAPWSPTSRCMVSSCSRDRGPKGHSIFNLFEHRETIGRARCSYTDKLTSLPSWYTLPPFGAERLCLYTEVSVLPQFPPPRMHPTCLKFALR